jgi:hypothetical protein
MTVAPVRSIQSAIDRSHTEFRSYVWPEIARAFPPGRLVEVESRPDDAARQFDMLGIDYLYAPNFGETYGVSQRIGSGQWRTVTMNEATIHRWSSFWGRGGAILPAVHVQAYLDGPVGSERAFISATVIAVDLFVRYVQIHPGNSRTNHRQATTFRSWTFDELDAAGVSIMTIPARQLEAPFGPRQNL